MIIRRLYCALVLLFFYFFIAEPSYAADIDLSDSTTWNIRVDGSAAGNKAGLFYKDMVKDIDGNGSNDLILCEYTADYNSRANSGSCFLIYDSLLDSLSGTGNTIDLADTSQWNIRFDGATGDGIGYVGVSSSDLNNNGSADLIFTAGAADYVRFRSGSVYVVFDDIFSSITGTGNTVDLSDTSNFTMRYDGGTSPCQLGESFVAGEDLNDNGIDDLIMASGHCGINGRSRSGALYVIYDDLLNSYSGNGNIIDLATETNYNLVYYEDSNSYFTISNDLVMKDIDGNGKLDIMSGVTNGDHNSRTDSGSVVVIYDSLIDDYTGTGNEIDLTVDANFSIRFDGAVAYDYLGWGGTAADDVDNNGEYDLILASTNTDNNSRADSGSLYIIYDSLLSTYTGTGNIVDMATTSSWNIRYDGPTENSYFGGYISDSMPDLNNNGKIDLIVPANGSGFNSRAGSGSVFLIYDDVFDAYSGTGNIIDMADTGNYTHRYDGAVAGDGLGFMIHQADVNNDSSVDLILSAYSADPNGRNSAGSVYIIFTYPHTITQSSLTRDNTQVTLKGSITAPHSTSNILDVSFQLSSQSPLGSWTSCTADDASFNSLSEDFTCVVTAVPTSSGTHTIYVRSSNSLLSYTPQSNYEAFSYTIGSNGSASGTHTDDSSKTPQIASGMGGVIEALTNDGNLQSILLIMQPSTVAHDVTLSADGQSKNFYNNIVSGGRLYRQVGQIQHIWLKDFHNQAKILHSLQRIPSILSISFTAEMLIQSGLKTTNASGLRLLYSPDALTWTFMPSSVADPSTMRVSAIDTIGGYYVIGLPLQGASVSPTTPQTVLSAETKQETTRDKTQEKVSPRSPVQRDDEVVPKKSKIWSTMKGWMMSVIDRFQSTL